MSNSQPLVSVIMGIYNCADTLAESLDSLLVQTYQNFGIIALNMPMVRILHEWTGMIYHFR